MAKISLLLTVVMLGTAAQFGQQLPNQESLGDVARRLRAEREQNTSKAAKLYTNEDLPARTPGEPIMTRASAPSASAPTTPENTGSPSSTSVSGKTASAPPPPEEDKVKTPDYWQQKFKKARADLAHAKELQQLAQDELDLMQIQEVRELNYQRKADLMARMQEKQSEIEMNEATTEALQKDLDDLEKAFKESGAPEDWKN
jgi:cell pole-organizing protein PopZ